MNYIWKACFYCKPCSPSTPRHWFLFVFSRDQRPWGQNIS